MEEKPTKPKPPVPPKGFLVKRRQIEQQIVQAGETERRPTPRNSTRISENLETITVESPKKMTSNDDVFQLHGGVGEAGMSEEQTDIADLSVDVRKRTKDFEEKERVFRLQSERDEDIKRENRERRKQYLQERLRKRRQAAASSVISPEAKPDTEYKSGKGQSPQSNVKDMDVNQELIPVLGEEPAPIPPHTSKDVLYSKMENIEMFEDLEDFAINLESENVTFLILMKSLLISELTELERVRILFHWISSQDLNAIEFPDNVLEDSPYGHLKAIKEERSNYPTLFQRLCKAAGIHCKKVNGFVKGVGYYPDHSFLANPEEFRGVWNAVYINGEWRLIDTHWGARFVDELDRKTLTYRYEEHYFLTDPDILINTHFPDEEPWQLLHNPLNLSGFEETIKHWPLYYDLKLHEISHIRGLIEVETSGFVQVKLRIPQLVRNQYDFSFKLQPKLQGKLDNNPLNEYVLHHQNTTEEVFDVHLMKSGQYILTLFAHLTEGKTDNTMLSRYQLNLANDVVKKADVMSSPFPPARPCYGPTHALAKIGLRAISHICPTVKCNDNGEAIISFSFVNDISGLKFMQELKDEEQLQKNCAVHYQQGTFVYFLVKALSIGNYKLSLFAKSENSANYSWFCHYLVHYDKKLPGKENNPFPDIPNGRLGPLNPDFRNLGLLRVNPLSRLEDMSVEINPDQHGNYSITFQHTRPLSMTAHLLSPGKKLDSSHVMVAKDEKHTVVFVSLPPNNLADTFALRLYAAKTKEKELSCVYTALIRLHVSSPRTPASFYPGYWGPNGKHFYDSGCTSVTFNNSSALYKHVPNLKTLPCRSYAGGGDMQMIINHQKPMQVSSKVLQLNGSEKEEMHQFSLVTSNQVNTTTLSVRFPRVGMYSVTLYGKKVGDEEDGLPELYCCLVDVQKSSNCPKRFPESYQIWEKSSVQLYSSLPNELPAHSAVNFKIALGQFQDKSVAPYAKVCLLEDKNRYIPPDKTTGCEYVWNCTVSPGSKVISLMVKKNADEKTMNYALKYNVDT